MTKHTDNQNTFQELLDVISKLRDPKDGCPWDKVQTHQTLKQYVIEEAYELVDAIDSAPEEICEELGDVLLQVLLHSEIAAESNAFDIFNVITNLKEKLIRRHPHVFGNELADTPEDVEKNWQEIKRKERGALDGIPRALPALLRTIRITERAAKSHLKIDTSDRDNLKNFAKTLLSDEKNSLTREIFKKALFEMAIFCNRSGYNPEELLQEACNEFTENFQNLENS
ncbi:MAG: nucleoside triphosphate pyrophosphohydrolase [Bdellovibrionota bacterium]|jgi:tetrapyrrole methylase family protein/MazG family protein